MIGYVYTVSNKYNLDKCIKYLKKNHHKFVIYDEYFVCDKQIDLFDLKYYVKYLGTINIKSFKNNCKKEVVKPKQIEWNNCKFFKSKKYYVLCVNNRKFFFKCKKKDEKIFNKLFYNKPKDFFEYSFSEFFVGNDKQLEILDFNEDKNMSNEPYEYMVFDFEEKQDEPIREKKYNIEEIFPYLTKNQLIIFVLSFLLNLSNKMISILLRSSSTYIFLEKQRILNKIRKLIKKGLIWQ